MSNTQSPSLPMPTVPSPLGTLLILPREVRDEIDGWVVGKGTVYEFSDPTALRHYGHRMKWSMDTYGESFNILRLSTYIRREALICLYAQGRFSFRRYLYDLSCLSQSDIPFFDRISNIEFDFDFEYTSKDLEDIALRRTAGPLSLFTGTQLSRNICKITLLGWRTDLKILFESPFVTDESHVTGAISQLTGFKEVRVILLTDYFEWKDNAGLHPPWVQVFDDVAPMAKMVGGILEPSLGVCSVEEDAVKERRQGFYLRWVFTFHPQDHLRQQSVGQKTEDQPPGRTTALSIHSAEGDSTEVSNP